MCLQNSRINLYSSLLGSRHVLLNASPSEMLLFNRMRGWIYLVCVIGRLKGKIAAIAVVRF